MKPAEGIMRHIERMYIDVEEGRATPDQIASVVHTANLKIERLIPSEYLEIVKPGVGEDRYRLKYFPAA